MAISVSSGTTKGRSNDAIGARRVTRVLVTLDTSYPTGGYAFDAKKDGGHQAAVARVLCFVRNPTVANGSAGRTFAYDYTNKKIVSFDALSTQTPNATNLSGVVLDVEILSD